MIEIEMAIEIDWPGIRAAAVAIGVRETARRAAALLPPAEQKRFVARVLKRSEREGWIVEKKKAIADKELAKQQAKPLSSVVASGAKAIGDAVLDHSRATRLALAKAARNGAEHLQEQSGAFIVRKSKNVRDLTAAAAQVGGWDQGKSSGVQFKLLQIGGTLTLVSEGQGSGNETLDD